MPAEEYSPIAKPTHGTEDVVFRALQDQLVSFHHNDGSRQFPVLLRRRQHRNPAEDSLIGSIMCSRPSLSKFSLCMQNGYHLASRAHTVGVLGAYGLLQSVITALHVTDLSRSDDVLRYVTNRAL